LDRLVPEDTAAADVEAGNFPGGRSCIAEEYEPVSADRARPEARFRLPAREGVPFGQIEIEKQYRLSKDTLTVDYVLSNRGNSAEAFILLPQIDLSFAGDTVSALQRIVAIRGPLKEELGAGFQDCLAADEIEMRDRRNEVTIHLASDNPFAFWIFSVRTPGTNGETREQYQSTCIIPRKNVSLKPGESYKTKFSLRFHQ
jgi:galactose mutarotase-like enzyme